MFLSFSTFIFSTGIKLFIRHPVVLFGILILSEQFDGFVQLLSCFILKEDSYVFIKYEKYWFYVRLSLRKNESRYKIWHWLELGWICKLKQWTNKEEIQPMEWLCCRVWLYFNFIYFYINLVYSKNGYNEPMQGWYPHICG